MNLTTRDLEKIAEDILFDRLITRDLYCATCGYNLRTLRYAGRCPECGSDYNARKLWKDGIFTAGMLEFPLGDWFGTLVTVGSGTLLIGSGLKPVVEWRLLFGVVFLLVSVFYIRSTWKRTARYLHFRSISRRIDADD